MRATLVALCSASCTGTNEPRKWFHTEEGEAHCTRETAIATPQNNEPRYNERIRAREVRLIGPDGSQVGVRTTADALTLARELDLDLVEVAPLANPPVCRIMDYGKFRYEEAQKAKESRKKTTHGTIKEVKFRPKIGKGDFDILDAALEQLGALAKVETQARLEGRNMTMVLSPDKKAPAKKVEKDQDQSAAPAPVEAAAEAPAPAEQSDNE